LNLRFSPEQEEFRSQVVEFLRDYRDLDAFFLQGHKWEKVRELFRAMGKRGWLSLGWPRDAGGVAEPLAYEYILWDEVAYARAARNPLASGIVAKTIARYGATEQKERWLPPIRRGDLHFSLGYSEPEAGSDLASARCRAERRGDTYVVTGQKCWQSYAQDMDHLWLLCRTGSQESRGRGLPRLIVDLQAPGITVGALPTMDGPRRWPTNATSSSRPSGSAGTSRRWWTGSRGRASTRIRTCAAHWPISPRRCSRWRCTPCACSMPCSAAFPAWWRRR
jgi:alkylation response protein AidB-like acyl-CoA dehydrogenase